MADAEPDPSIPLAWIVVFLLLTLGLGAAAVLFVGGNPTGAGVIVPLV
jgi:hypothetical protein